MTSTDTTRPRHRPTALLLAIFGGTIAWALRFTLGYLFVPAACETGAWVLHAITIAAALAAAAALVVSLRWARELDHPPLRFGLWSGAALNVFFLAAILLEGSGVLFVDACAKAALP